MVPFQGLVKLPGCNPFPNKWLSNGCIQVSRTVMSHRPFSRLQKERAAAKESSLPKLKLSCFEDVSFRECMPTVVLIHRFVSDWIGCTVSYPISVNGFPRIQTVTFSPVGQAVPWSHTDRWAPPTIVMKKWGDMGFPHKWPCCKCQ